MSDKVLNANGCEQTIVDISEDHCCGLQGFGMELSDICPACSPKEYAYDWWVKIYNEDPNVFFRQGNKVIKPQKPEWLKEFERECDKLRKSN